MSSFIGLFSQRVIQQARCLNQIKSPPVCVWKNQYLHPVPPRSHPMGVVMLIPLLFWFGGIDWYNYTLIWLSTVSSKWFIYPLTFIMFNRHFVVTISFVLCDPLLVYFVFWCIPPLGNHVMTFVIPFLFCVWTLTPLPIPPPSDPDDLYILFRSLPHTSRHTMVYQFDLWLDNQVPQVL